VLLKINGLTKFFGCLPPQCAISKLDIRQGEIVGTCPDSHWACLGDIVMGLEEQGLSVLLLDEKCTPLRKGG
jgi:hypothetical protein